jgi:hypothetical protein
MKPRNQGRKPKKFESDPFSEFMIAEFCRFAWQWKKRRDLENLAIECAPNEWPIVGSPQVFSALLLAAAKPETLEKDGDTGKFFLGCLKRSPDFVAAWLNYFRNILSKMPDSKKAILFGNLDEKFSDAEKTSRAKIRKMIEKNAVDRFEAMIWDQRRIIKK